MGAPADDFTLHAPLNFWLDKSMPEPLQRRFGGLVSTETRDKEGEIVKQVGLDWSEFLGGYGWFNDNHTKKTAGPVGIPSRKSIKIYERGQKLPDGTIAPNRGTWAEGYLLNNARAREIWDFAQDLAEFNKALAEAGMPDHMQRLGFSIEGGIRRREGPNHKTIAEAAVRNVAITNCPVNPETGLSLLAKSLDKAQEEIEEEEKALTTVSGAALIPESLESDVKKPMTKSEALLWASDRIPSASLETLARFVDRTLLLKRHGLL
jgi:hypothetical protein